MHDKKENIMEEKKVTGNPGRLVSARTSERIIDTYFCVLDK